MKKLTILCLCVCFALSAFGQLPWPADSPGPDTYGYTWKTNSATDGPVYDWIEIVSNGLGTEVMGLSDDNAISNIPMGLEFQYYWTTKNTVCVGSNGYLGLADCINIASTADGFPLIPSDADPNDIIAPYMCDLNFAGAGNQGKVYYFTDAANNRFVVTYQNVPYWSNDPGSTNGYQGDNTFQVILDASDSTVTFQYQNMVGNWNSGYDGVARPFVTGIENTTGKIGLLPPSLPTQAANKPVGETAITFYPPATPLTNVTDISVATVQNPERAGFFVPWPQPGATNNFPLRSLISNAGNVDVTSDIQILGTVKDTNENLLWQDQKTVVGGLPVGGSSEVNFGLPFNPPDPGPYFYEVSITNAGQLLDINSNNNVRVAELIATDTTGAAANGEVIFDYTSDNVTRALSVGSVIGFGTGAGDGGGGVFFESFAYPLNIVALEFLPVWAQGNTPVNGFNAVIHRYDENQTPGVIIAQETVLPAQFNTTGGWTRVDLSSPVPVDSGGFYVGFKALEDFLLLLTEDDATAPPISRRSYEIIADAWATYRSFSSEDLYIRAIVTMPAAVATDIDKEIDLVQDFKVYPNPSSGVFNLSYGMTRPAPVEIRVYDMLGAKVYRETNFHSFGEVKTIDLSQLSAGVYTVQLSTQEGVESRQIVIE